MIELISDNPSHRIALRGVRVRATLVGLCVKATIEQTFVNQEERAIEAIYTFPLPEGAAVCGFEVVTSDRVLTGEIDATDDALERYHDAIDQGHGAFALESDRPDVFTVRVGNLKPKQSATIRISYVNALERVDDSIRVCFPTTVAPRYVSLEGTNPIDAAMEGDALNPPHAMAVPYGLSMEVDVNLGREIVGIASPTHAISVVEGNEPNSRRVHLSAGMTEMNRDIVFTIKLPVEHSPLVEMVGTNPNEQFLAVSFVPEFDLEELNEPKPSETIFVLDCSGSMQGQSIEQATAALELCLRSLNAGDRFNVCRFGSTFEMMSSEPLSYSTVTLDRAIDYVRRGADLGGTEILPPLQAIFSAKPIVGQMRNVILLTDGQVSNEPAVIELARKHRQQNRIFSFGIGSACSAYLVKGLARATGGAAEFISGTERIEEKVLRTFSRIASPMLADVYIDWGGADVQTLAELPPVFDGDVMTVFGRIAGKSTPTSVALRGSLDGQEKSWQIRVPAPRPDHERVIPAMWARRMIQSIEEVNGISRSAIRAGDTRERKLLIELSKQYRLLCALTTFVAIEHRSLEDRNEGKPELRRIPVQLAQGWGGMGSLRDAAGAVACMAAPSAPASGLVGRARSFFSRSWERPDGPRLIREESASERPCEVSALTQLLMLQQAQGYFRPDGMIDRQFHDAGATWDDDLLEVKLSRELRKQVEATLMALWILDHVFADERPAWTRAARKARRWVETTLGKPVDPLLAAMG